MTYRTKAGTPNFKVYLGKAVIPAGTQKTGTISHTSTTVRITGDTTTVLVDAIDQNNRIITATGDISTNLTVKKFITITGSTGNDGVYNIEDWTVSGGNTKITVDRDIPDATADGSVKYSLTKFTEELDEGDWIYDSGRNEVRQIRWIYDDSLLELYNSFGGNLSSVNYDRVVGSRYREVQIAIESGTNAKVDNEDFVSGSSAIVYVSEGGLDPITCDATGSRLNVSTVT